jgi:hypothetical protein
MGFKVSNIQLRMIQIFARFVCRHSVAMLLALGEFGPGKARKAS